MDDTTHSCTPKYVALERDNGTGRNEPLKVQLRSSSFDCIDVRRGDVRTVDEAMRDDVFQLPWFTEKLDESFFAAEQFVAVGGQPATELVAAFDDALLMEGAVPPSVDARGAVDGGEEVVDATAQVAVHRAEGGEIDVGDIEEAVGLDEEATMSGSVTR